MISGSTWLVDMGYVVKAAKVSDMRLDYIAGQRFLSGRYGRTHTYLFNSFDPAYGIASGLQRFYHAMEQQGMTVRLHPMSGHTGAGDHRQRRVDVDLACHAVWQACRGEAGTVILTSGDQDLIPAVEICRAQFGVKVVLFSYHIAVSRDLVESVDERLCVEDFRRELER